MGEEWTELVWTSISLIALSIVLVIAFNFMQLGKTLTNEVYQDQAVVEQRQEIRNFLPYDETVLSGSEAFSAALDISSKGYFALIELSKQHAWQTCAVIQNQACQLESSSKWIGLREHLAINNQPFDVQQFKITMATASGRDYCYNNTAGTARDFQELFDNITHLAVGRNMTFNELYFMSYVVYDMSGKPVGLYLAKCNADGTGVIGT